MIPSLGTDPKINILTIGAEILKILIGNSSSVENILGSAPKQLGVSIDHVILSLDWLFSINAIFLDDEEIYINEAD
jgi:hypothetical protein